jgi:hypothetical protein
MDERYAAAVIPSGGIAGEAGRRGAGVQSGVDCELSERQ